MQQSAKALPGNASRIPAPNETVRDLTRPRAMRLGMLLVLGSILSALAKFSVIVEPGFIRLATLPALPLLGAHIAQLAHSRVIFVTDRRVVSAGRWSKPLSIKLVRLRAIRVQQSGLESRLRHGRLFLLVQPPQELGEGVFLTYELPRLADASTLGSAIAEATAMLGIELIGKESKRVMGDA